MADIADKQTRNKPLGGHRPSDVTQDAALLAFHYLADFKGQTEAEWKQWIASILRNRTHEMVRDARRKKRDIAKTVPLDSVNPDTTLPAQNATASQITAHNEEWRDVLSDIYQLPTGQKDAIWLCHLEELSIAEAAGIMQRSEAAVASLVQRGLRALRRRADARTERPAPQTDTDADDVMGTETAAAFLAFIRRRDAGEALDIDVFLADYPRCADELRPMLMWIERIQAIRGCTRPSGI